MFFEKGHLFNQWGRDSIDGQLVLTRAQSLLPRSNPLAVARRVYRELAYPEAPCHILLEPFLETGVGHTQLVFLLRRLADKFRFAGIEPPASATLVLTIHAADGRQLHCDEIRDQAVSGILVWDSGHEFPPETVPIDGLVAIETILLDGAGRRIRESVLQQLWGRSAGITDLYIDYYQDGCISTTHSNISVKRPVSGLRAPLAKRLRELASRPELERFKQHQVRPGSVAVFDDGIFESALLHYTWLEAAPHEETIELRNVRGEVLRAPLPVLPPLAFSRVALKDVFPHSREFLGGKPGNLLLDNPPSLLSHNARFYVQTSHVTGRTFGIDHSYLEFATSPSFSSRREWMRMGKGYMSPFVVVERGDTHTAAALFNMHDVQHPKTIGMLVYDCQGNLVVDRRPVTKVPPTGLETLWLRDLLDEAGHRGDFLGHAEVFYCPEDEPVPEMLHHQALYRHRDYVEGVQVGVALWNWPPGWDRGGIADPQGLGWQPIYAPARVDQDFVTYLGLTNCSTFWEYDTEALVTLTLINANDEVAATGDVSIPPNGTWFDSIETVFPGAHETLAAHLGRGLVLIQPRTVRTLGAQFFQMHRRSGQFSSEHTL